MLLEANTETNMSSVQIIYLMLVIGVSAYIGGLYTKDSIDRNNQRKNK